MHIPLNSELERYIEQQVRDGHFPDAASRVTEALLTYQEHREPALSASQEDRLRRALRAGMDDADAGRVSDFDAERIIAEERARRAAS